MNMLNDFIESHGPLLESFKHVTDFNVEPKQNENYDQPKSNRHRSDFKEENDGTET